MLDIDWLDGSDTDTYSESEFDSDSEQSFIAATITADNTTTSSSSSSSSSLSSSSSSTNDNERSQSVTPFAEYDARCVAILKLLKEQPYRPLFSRHYMSELLLVYISSDQWRCLDVSFACAMLSEGHFESLRMLTVVVRGEGKKDKESEMLGRMLVRWCHRQGVSLNITAKNSDILDVFVDHPVACRTLSSLQVSHVTAPTLDYLLNHCSRLKSLSVSGSWQCKSRVSLIHMAGLEYLDMDTNMYERIAPMGLPLALRTLKLTGLALMPLDVVCMLSPSQSLHRLYLEVDLAESANFCLTTLETETIVRVPSVKELHVVGNVSDTTVLKLLKLTPSASVLVVRDARHMPDSLSLATLNCQSKLEMISWSTDDSNMSIHNGR